MIEMIRHPPKAFADVVHKHFWLKRDEIIAQVEEWIDRRGGLRLGILNGARLARSLKK